MKYFYIILICVFTTIFTGCVDEEVTPEPPVYQDDEIDPDLPDEIRNGFSITFNMELSQMEGTTRTNNAEMMDIDNFVDLEKVRILFFVCASDESGKTVADTTYTSYYSYNGNPQNKPFMTGKNDHFLFESKSRWVSKITGDNESKATWQVTAPVFTYGNNDEYRWDDIRTALTNYPFKVVVLANRPNEVEFGNFDSKFGKDPATGLDRMIKYNTGRGPVWGPEQTWVPVECRTKEGDNLIDWNSKPTINDLHHCQWDVVYASKNSGDKGNTSNPYAAPGVYNFIMKNPDPTLNSKNELDPPNEEDIFKLNQKNMMGALSMWTRKENFGDGSENAYFLPNKETQAIPMYGVQVFDPIPDWSPGTPYNISNRHHGQSGQLIRKTIFLLRSLVKLELIIPQWMEKNGTLTKIVVEKPYLRYSNVTARCEPLDVATPTERLWHEENWKLNDYCEWKNLFDRGPVVYQETTANGVDYFQRRMAWYYGAWRDWWDFNPSNGGLADGAQSTYFDLNENVNGKRNLPYPRIFNPVIQRNDAVRIDNCLMDMVEYDDPSLDNHDQYYHFVVYTGERNINDPTTFGQTNSFNCESAHIAYFKFNVRAANESAGNAVTYYIPLAEFASGSLSATRRISSEEADFKNYRKDMGKSSNPDDWNWPLLRNHTYTYTVRKLGSYTDKAGFDIKVVNTEKRTAPDIFYH